MKTLLISAAVLALSAPASAAVYNVNIAGGGLSATGSITTDGTLGTLAQANVTDWLFNLNDGIGTFTLTGPSNSQFLLTGNLSATATGLTFDFSGGGIALFQNPVIGSSMNFICFASAFCGGGSSRISITTATANFGGGIAQQGVQQIASLAGGTVPEPASWALMIGGFGAVGAAMRRRQRVTVRFG